VNIFDNKGKDGVNIDDVDWEEGTPSKLKNVSISELETKLSLVIDELIGKGADTVANIESIDFSGGVNSSVKLNITFSKKMGASF
jgi:hypothetical protein